MTPSRALYLYAVVPAHTRLDAIRGIAEAPVEVVTHAQLGVVVSDVVVERLASLNAESQDAGAIGDLARCHDAVVRAAMTAASAVLPFRLGTVVVDRDIARGYLAERAEELQSALHHVAECQEWGVTVCDDISEPAGPAEPAATPAAARGAGGTAYLARRRQQLAEAEQRRRARLDARSEVAAELRARAIDATAGHPRSDDVVLDESYLVRRDAEPEFVDAVDRCGDRLQQQGLLLQLSGPWPPYSFAPAAPEIDRG